VRRISALWTRRKSWAPSFPVALSLAALEQADTGFALVNVPA